MLKKLFTFIKHDFSSQVFSISLILAVIYSYFLFDDMSILTISLIVAAFILAGFSTYLLFTSKVTIQRELVLFLPLSVFVMCLFFGVLNKYNEVDSFNELMTYTSLSRLIDFGIGATLVYSSFIALMGLSCANAAPNSFNIQAGNIETLTGKQHDFIHYRITKSYSSILTLNNSIFGKNGLIVNGSVIGYNELYNYLKDQNMRFNALTDDDFLVMNMVKI
jgi:hypothetical protein